jgi:hypothetical protein
MAVARIEELEAKLPNDYCRTVLKGGLMVLESENPIRAHLFAAALRELVGYLLHSAATDDEVMAAPWYKPEEDRPTRRQRTTFAIQGGLSDTAVDRLGVDPADMHRDLAKAISLLNKRTHLRPETLLTDEREIQAFAEQVVAAVLEFLDTIADLRDTISEAVVDDASLPVFETFLMESNETIDILSSRSIVEGTDVESVRVIKIGAKSIDYEAEGTIHVELNYRPRDDGASMSDSFPFKCKLTGRLEPLKAIDSVSDMNIDTRSFYD